MTRIAPPRPAIRPRRPARHAVVALAWWLMVAIGTTHPAGAASSLRLPATLLPGGPALDLADVPADLAAQFTGVALVERGGGCSGVLVAPDDGPAPPEAPAYVLTNGHCIDFLPPTSVVTDLPGGGVVRFGWPGGPVEQEVAITGVPWASMKGTDLAILALDRRMADLDAVGVHAVPLSIAGPVDRQEVAIVGGPTRRDAEPRQLVVATCRLGPAHALLEATWYWTDFPVNDCADVRPGSSGSPVLDLASGRLVGLVNTGTDGSEGRSDCMLDRPCEVGPDGVRSPAGAVYGPALTGLAGCFDAGWRFVGPGGDCPLDPGVGLLVEGATEVTNPDRSTPGGRAGATTWGARLSAPDDRSWWYRIKTGTLGGVDCQDPAGYGDVIALHDGPLIDTPLPRAEGRYQLCLLAGPTPVPDASWQAARFATVVTAWVDRTPPIVPLQLDVVAEAGRWRIAPEIAPPELVTVTWKVGAAASTRCDDPAGYVVWRHAPRTLAASGRPWRVCAIGHDPVGNPTPVLERVLG